MIVVTTEQISGYKIREVKGPVFGIVVRARGLAGDIKAFFRGLLGGEVKEYTVMLEDARRQAIDRMIENATAMGANAVTMIRFDSSTVATNMSEVIAYGTAVVIEEE